mgnify:CR=1 FL=1
MAKSKSKKVEKVEQAEKPSVKKLKARPFGDRVLVKPDAAEEMTAGGIIIPDTVKQEKPERGRVVAVGDGKMSEDGRVLPMRVSVGDKVMFRKQYGDNEIKIDGEDYLFISETDIIAIL